MKVEVRKERAKMIRTLYAPLHQTGKVVHTATIRSDWKDSDFALLNEMFPRTSIKTVRETISVSYLGQEYHHTDFNSLYRKQLI